MGWSGVLPNRKQVRCPHEVWCGQRWWCCATQDSCTCGSGSETGGGGIKKERGEEREKELSNKVAQGIRCCWRKDKSSCIIQNLRLWNSCQDVSFHRCKTLLFNTVTVCHLREYPHCHRSAKTANRGTVSQSTGLTWTVFKIYFNVSSKRPHVVAENEELSYSPSNLQKGQETQELELILSAYVLVASVPSECYRLHWSTEGLPDQRG